MFDPRYDAQVRLLLRCLPEIGRHRCFALKGGTAINLFARDLPRVSVDIDLTYLPVRPRQEAMQEVHDTLQSVKGLIEQHVRGSQVREHRRGNHAVALFASTDEAVIEIKPNLVFRGSVYEPQDLDLCPAAQEHFQAFVTAQTLSAGDLYGGKLCAALDRQHPRDLFDVKLLLEDTGITREIRRAFVVYLAGHDRPMNELLVPRLKGIQRLYEDQFAGMARSEVSSDDLRHVQEKLAPMIVSALDENERTFLLSMKRGEPEWNRLGIEHLAQLPALQWKLTNIRKMDPGKRKAALDQLARVLAT